MIRPTGRALDWLSAGLALSTVPVFLGERYVAAWFAGLVVWALAMVWEGLRITSHRRFTLQFDNPEVLELQQIGEFTVSVSAKTEATVEIRLETTGPIAPIPAAVVRTTRDAVMQADFALRPERRGTIRIVAAHLRWRGPLGLLWNEHVAHAVRDVRVSPDFTSARRQALRVLGRRDYRAGLKVERYIGDGSEFESLREFVPGMDRRAVDWKASARHRVLLAREYQAERNHDVMLCVDSGRLMGEPLEGIPRLDHAIRAALSLAQVSLATGDRVGTFTFAERPGTVSLPRAGIQSMQPIQQRMVEVDYSSSEPNTTWALTELSRRLRRRTLIVLFTDFVDSISAALMMPAVHRLSRRHVVLFVTLRDPLLNQLAAAKPASDEDLHRAALASDLIQERELVLESLRVDGAQIIATHANELGPALIDHYLHVKRRELV